ncbi:MAG: MarP family serine protease [Actinomycetota bacterium]
MNFSWVDLVILFLVIISMAEGIRRGAATQVLSYAGFGIGLFLGAFFAPRLARLSDDPILRTMISTVVLFGTAMAGGGAGRLGGSRVAAHLNRAQLGPADSIAGAGVSLVSTLLVVWLSAGMLASVPIESVSQGIHDSRVVSTLNRMLPPSPAIFSRIRQVLTSAGLPQVFAEFEPTPGTDIELPSDAQLRAAVESAAASTVKVQGNACNGRLTGSGFVAARGHVMTNAHVLAGVDSPGVIDRRGFHRAVPVYFDPQVDVAVLRVGSPLAGPVLNINSGVAERGRIGAVIGYPGGGPLKAVPAGVLDHLKPLGRDIYGRGLTPRNVYRLKADVRPGNSGGPFVGSAGEVLGLIFSASDRHPNIGYALTGAQVAPTLSRAVRSGEVDTGPCAA